jgi:hypothetical protein
MLLTPDLFGGHVLLLIAPVLVADGWGEPSGTRRIGAEHQSR